MVFLIQDSFPPRRWSLPSLRRPASDYLFWDCDPLLASRHPPPTRSLLPVLDTLTFKWPSEYLDDLVARIDAPRLNIIEIDFFKGVLDTPHFTQFIRRTPMFRAHEKAYVAFLRLEGAAVGLSSRTSGYGELKVKIRCRGQVSTLKRFCYFCTPYFPIST